MSRRAFDIGIARYWRDISCIFLRETDGTLHLARVYPEGFDVQDARAAGSNRFVIAADDAIEIWAFDSGMAFEWHRPKTQARFLWRDQIVLSESERFAAVIGEVVFQKTYVFLIDLEVPELVEIDLLGSSEFQPVIRAVEDTGHITLSQDRRIGSPQIRIDPTTGRAQPVAPTTDACVSRDLSWPAPPSEEASRMLEGLPGNLKVTALPLNRTLAVRMT